MIAVGEASNGLKTLLRYYTGTAVWLGRDMVQQPARKPVAQSPALAGKVVESSFESVASNV